MHEERQGGGVLAELALGAAAGCLATVPMTWAMEVLHRRLPREERYPLPPRQITMRLVEEAGGEDQPDEPERRDLTLLAHFGMGTAAGALYGLVAHRQPLPGPVAGAGFGLAVWAGNYLGLLPALGILCPATEHPPRRTALMIAAHLVWGAVTGAILGAFSPGRRSSSPASA
jgi:hypothetical protein